MLTNEMQEVIEEKKMESKSFEELEFTDDFMFCKILESNPDLCKELAEMITGEKFGEIKKDESQKSIRIIPDGHGVRFDVYLSDGSTVADIEMQTVTKENLPKRSRYYQSAIDIATFEKSKDYKTLTKSYIIFIVLKNPFPEHNLRKYTFVNTCREEKSLELGDEAIKIFLTPDGEKGVMSEEMEGLMSYLKEKKASDEFTRALDEQIRIAKEGSSWKIEYMQMREKIEEQYNAGKKDGRKEGNEEALIATAKRMLALKKFDYDDISKSTGLTVKEIKKLEAEADSK